MLWVREFQSEVVERLKRRHFLTMKESNLVLNSEDSQNSVESYWVDVPISDIVLTPLTCASLVNEVLRGLLYQKCQIPYPYSWLQQIVMKKRQSPETSGIRPNINIANHFRTVSLTYDKVEKVMKSLAEAFTREKGSIKEVVIMFGTTPQSPKEAVTINVSHMARGHLERNHIGHINKYQQKILRTIFLSQRWLDSIDTSMSCTNVYIFLKKSYGDYNRIDYDEDLFISTRPLSFHPKMKHIKINLYPEIVDANCCNNLLIHGDIRGETGIISDDSEDQVVCWYQFKDLISGFKDCYVNKRSASELW